MGQQQLLLIVLGLIVVGVAVVVSINVFTSNSEETAKDAIISDTITLGAVAQQYFRKPRALGGGSNSFANWSIPDDLDTTDHGTYEILEEGNANQVVITGSPIESRGYNWTVVTTITVKGVTSVISS
jgi:hypothetical protein